MIILCGSHNQDFTKTVANHLGVQISDSNFQKFANSEVKFRLGSSVRGSNVFVFQTHFGDVNGAIMEQAILIDAAKRASARSITAVCPYLGYSRQDRKSKDREPITARLVTDILAAAGADRIVSIDMHSGQTQGFFNGPFDHLIAMPVLIRRLRKLISEEMEDLVIVSPDAGRVKLTERYCEQLGSDMAIIHKNRKIGDKAEAVHLIGEVRDKHCLINDDMIDTAGTICAAAELLIKNGARDVWVVTTHGLFSEPAVDRIQKSPISKVIVTDTLPAPKGLIDKLDIVPIGKIVADAIKAMNLNNSVSSLFNEKNHF